MIVGYHDSKVVSVNNHVLKMGTVTPHDAAQMLMMTPTVDAIVLSINDLSLLETGLPFPHFDVLVLAGTHLDYGPHTGAAQQPALRALLRALLSCCDGKVVTLKEAQLQVRRPAGLAAEWLEQPVPAEQLINTLLDSVAEAEQKHAQAPIQDQNMAAASRH